MCGRRGYKGGRTGQREGKTGCSAYLEAPDAESFADIGNGMAGLEEGDHLVGFSVGGGGVTVREGHELTVADAHQGVEAGAGGKQGDVLRDVVRVRTKKEVRGGTFSHVLRTQFVDCSILYIATWNNLPWL